MKQRDLLSCISRPTTPWWKLCAGSLLLVALALVANEGFADDDVVSYIKPTIHANASVSIDCPSDLPQGQACHSLRYFSNGGEVQSQEGIVLPGERYFPPAGTLAVTGWIETY